jgi:hypothetical protein
MCISKQMDQLHIVPIFNDVSLALGVLGERGGGAGGDESKL